MAKSSGLFQLVVVGCSAGGIEALKKILTKLNSPELPPFVIVQHRGPDGQPIMIKFFQEVCQLPVKEAESKETLAKGHIYIAPAGYHLLVSDELSFDLSVEEPVNFSRPSIDVLFESVSELRDLKVLGIILTGANQDGTEGLKRIVERGGEALVQDPGEAQFKQMPESALRAVPSAKKFSLEEIIRFLMELSPS